MLQWSWFRQVVPFGCFLWQQLRAPRWRESAAALTYTSLFALVPIITVSYTLLTFLPQLISLQGHIAAFIFSHFLPDTGYQVWDYLQQFSQQARKLTVPGLLMLIVTALLMLKTIENAFNSIWEVKQGRRGVPSFLIYWAVLSLGPVLTGAALMLSTYLLSLSILSDVQQFTLVQQALGFLPLLLSTAALCLMYCTVPNCQVPFKHALAGSFVTALVFGLFKDLFALSVKYSSYTLVYGAFAAVPLFLTWLYLCWLIVLFGAVLVRGFSTYSARSNEFRDEVMLALMILLAFWQAQQSGRVLEPLWWRRCNDKRLHGISLSQWERQRDILLREQVILESAEGDFVLCRDLHQLSLWEVRQWFGGAALQATDDTAAVTVTDNQGSEHPGLQRARQLLQAEQHHAHQRLGISLAELFQGQQVH